METKNLKLENEEIRRQLDASFALSGYLMEARSEQAVVLAALKIGAQLLGAVGAAFVPFNEWKLSVPALTFGQADFLKNEEWQKRLHATATRHTCRVCDKKQAGAECVLLRETVEGWNIYCVSLHGGGREIGILSFFFTVKPSPNGDQRLFLAEMARMAGLALDRLRVQAQEVEKTRLIYSSVDLKEELVARDAKYADVLEQLEYKAILDERSRLAREIHDGLAQTLAFLKMEAARMQAYLSKGDVSAVTRTLQACHKTLSEAYLDARQAIDNLRRVPDETLGDWLEMTAIDFSSLTGVEANVSIVQLQHEFSQGIKAQLVRIVQEALTNIRKHAQASEVLISARERVGAVTLEIRDDGCGFAPEETQPASQYGLRSMRERAEAIGADFQIISMPGAGTTVRVQIPIRERASL